MKRIAIITVLSPLLLMPVGALAQDLPVKPNAGNMNLIAQTINWGGAAVAVLLVIAAWLTLKFIDNLVDELGSSFAEQRLLLQRANAFFRFFVYIATVAGVVLLSFDLSEQFLTVLGGGIVVAIGFGTRDLLASLVAGVMIIFDRPFQVGDRVRFAGEYGDIVQIGLRSVKLRTLDDSIVTIPNNLLLNEISSSSNFGVLDMQIEVDFHIGVDQDAVLARRVVLEVAAISRFVFLHKPVVVNVDEVLLGTGTALRICLKAYVLDTQYEKDFVTDVTLRVQQVFRDNGILPPAILHRDIQQMTVERS